MDEASWPFFRMERSDDRDVKQQAGVGRQTHCENKPLALEIGSIRNDGDAGVLQDYG